MKSWLAGLTLAFVLLVAADARRPPGLLAPALASADPPAPLVVPLAHQGRDGFWVESAAFRELDLAHRLRPLDLEILEEHRALVAELRSEVVELNRALGAAQAEARISGQAWTAAEAALRDCQADALAVADRFDWGPFWGLGGALAGGAIGSLGAAAGCRSSR